MLVRPAPPQLLRQLLPGRQSPVTPEYNKSSEAAGWPPEEGGFFLDFLIFGLSLELGPLIIQPVKQFQVHCVSSRGKL